MEERRLAGIGGIAFAAAFVVGFTLFGPKGGRYSAAEVDSFVGQAPSGVTISIGMFLIKISGLIVLMAHLSETSVGTGRRVAWATSLLAAASFLDRLGARPRPVERARLGRPSQRSGNQLHVLERRDAVLFGVGGMTLGIALVTLAVGGWATPAWVRATKPASPAHRPSSPGRSSWFCNGSPNQWLPGPFYLVVVWGLVIGVWLLVSTGRPDLPGNDR